MEEPTQTKFTGWALVEIMGHRRAAGHVTTEYIGSAAFLRIVTPEVPATEYTVDRDQWIDGCRVYSGSVMEVSRERSEILVGSSSIYAITPTTESDILRHAPVTHRVIVAAERKVIMGPAESQNDSDSIDQQQDDGSDFPY